MTDKIKIEIVSDVVCPWCYIASNRLRKALNQAKVDYEITWVPFQLHPGIGEGGNDMYSFLEKKYGTPGEEQMEGVRSVAEKDGLPMNIDKMVNMPDTLNAHRVMHLAKEKGFDNEMSALFFDAYFVEGKNLNLVEELLKIAEKGGLNIIEVERYLASSDGLEEMAIEEERYKMEEGVWVVPAFIFNDDEMIEGAHPIEDFIKFFNDMNIVPAAGDGCSDDGCAI